MEVPPLIDPVDRCESYSARAQFVGLVLNWGLYGMLISQTFTYFATFPHDVRTNKATAYSMFLLKTLQTVLLTYDMYCAFVLAPGDAEFLNSVRLTWLDVPTLCGISGWIAAMLYANRIYKISRSRKVSGIIVSISFVQLATAVATGIQARSNRSFVTFRQPGRHKLMPVIWTVSMTMCDIIIALVMTYYLVQLRREFHQSSPLIRRLMALTVETGMATALVAASAAALFSLFPDSVSFTIPGFTLSKLYSNSLLRVLNSRNRTEYAGDVVTLPVSFERSSTITREPR